MKDEEDQKETLFIAYLPLIVGLVLFLFLAFVVNKAEVGDSANALLTLNAIILPIIIGWLVLVLCTILQIIRLFLFKVNYIKYDLIAKCLAIQIVFVVLIFILFIVGIEMMF